jgi:asparagine synthase (glutamine-hydrolysing)
MSWGYFSNKNRLGRERAGLRNDYILPDENTVGIGSCRSAPGSLSAKDSPFFHLRFRDGSVQLAGTPTAFVGNRLGRGKAVRGTFAEWQWDGMTLTATVDPLGYFSLFVYSKGTEIAVSPSILHLLALGADPEPDPVAMAVFHRIGLFVEDDTPFRYIKVMPPGGRLTWRDGVATVTGGAPVPQEEALTRDQAVEAFIELPRASLRRFLAAWDGPVVLPLSGGRDSRHILLELAHQGRKPDSCVTFHVGGRYLDKEVLAARAVAERVGVRHILLGNPRMRLRDTVRALLLTQLCADEHAQMMPMHDYLSGSPAAVLDGIGGDILTNPDDSAAEFITLARRGDFEAIARSMAEGHARIISRPGHSGGAGALHSPELEAAAIDRIAGAIRRFEAAPDPYQSFWFWNRTRREINFVSTGILGEAAMVDCPYLDPEFVKLGLSLPWSVTCSRKLHDEAIARAFPACADIPYAEELRSTPLPKLRLSRLHNELDGLRIASMARKDVSAFDVLRSALARGPLHRRSMDLYSLHKSFVEQMNSGEARRLIELRDRLDRAATKGMGVVTDVFPGD